MKRKGDMIDLVVGGVEVMKMITEDEFKAGVKRLAQGGNTESQGQPESGRRNRRSAEQAQPDDADTARAETSVPDAETQTGRSRRVRRTR